MTARDRSYHLLREINAGADDDARYDILKTVLSDERERCAIALDHHADTMLSARDQEIVRACAALVRAMR